MQRIVVLIIFASLISSLNGMNKVFDKKKTRELLNAVQDHTIEKQTVLGLLEQKADPNGIDDNGIAPLLHALRRDCSKEILETLVQKGAYILYVARKAFSLPKEMVMVSGVDLRLQTKAFDEKVAVVCDREEWYRGWVSRSINATANGVDQYHILLIENLYELDFDTIKRECN